MANPRAEFSPIFHRPPLKLPNNAASSYGR